MQAEHFLGKCRHPGIFGWHILWHLNAHLQPIHLFLIPQCLQMFRIVRGIVYRHHRAHTVKVLHEHPFLVEIEYPHRPLDTIHPPFAAPMLHSLQQSRRHVLVVNELDKTEADILRVPFFIGTVVDNAGYAPHHIPVFIVCNERLDFRKVQPCIFTGVECITDIRIHIGDIIRAAGI